MGLDQNWFRTTHKADAVENLPDVVTEENYDGELFGDELAYHRKVPALQAYMGELASRKGFEGEFNCVYVRVTEEDLNDLEQKVMEKSLDSEASGFFWGGHCDEDYDEIKEAISIARTSIKDGYAVYYTSWW